MAYSVTRVIDRENDEMLSAGGVGRDTYPKPQPTDPGK
jgi:hypothetical protein